MSELLGKTPGKLQAGTEQHSSPEVNGSSDGFHQLRAMARVP